MKGKINSHPKANTNGFRQNPQNINKVGLNRSLLKTIKKYLYDNDGYLVIEDAELLNNKGDVLKSNCTVRVALPNNEKVALHYLKRSTKSDRVLIDLLDRTDGKSIPTVIEHERLDKLDNKLKASLSKIETSILSSLAKKYANIVESEYINLGKILSKYPDLAIKHGIPNKAMRSILKALKPRD